MIHRALVIGAGIAGMQAALDIANSGYEVVLVERQPSIGGHMAQLSETFPTLDCAQCILTPRTVEVGHHENIRLYTYSELEAISGSLGDFTATIRRKASYVNWELCTGCGVCQEKCPWKAPAEFERGVGTLKAIYTLSPQAVPNKPVINPELCVRLKSLAEGGKAKCGACAKFCPTGAIDFEQGDRLVEERVGAAVVATGYDLFPAARLGEYGGGRLPDVIDALAFERLLSASGPTSGKVMRPSDGREPKEIVFVQCAGSRDSAPLRNGTHGVPYCSKICCMVAAKQAILYKHRVHDGQPYVFYIDVRAGGKGYEEFINRAQQDEGVVYLRGKVSKIYQDGDKVMVWGSDTLSGRKIEIAADMVVLSLAVLPAAGSARVQRLVGLEADEDGFYVSLDGALDPLNTTRPGVFIAGAGSGPKDIPEAVAQASGAAAKVLALFKGLSANLR
ncbi:MAG: CoB--CoM heterodisulfide reductase iron-sulfur subunit A family protein [Thermoflexales bacterium]|nr:CoB--CoM heterodisulfide reductase iron-sulfur subunit A family protein [Thermoflexales bacterium]